MESFGAIALIPTIIVLVVALITHRTIESLLAGVIIGLLITSPTEVVSEFASTALTVMGDGVIGWIILVCGLFGSLIALLVRTGSAVSFSEFMIRFVKSQRSSLVVTWILGLIIFIDDYLNALAISSSMKKVTDKYKVSREMLAYIVDSTAAPICVLVPFSTWAIFFSGLLEDNGVAEQGQGLTVYIQAIPYMFYAWVAAIIVPLVAMGKFPLLGAMKTAELRAKGGQVIPDGADGIELIGGESLSSARTQPHLLNFFIPIASLIFFTWYFDVDILMGVLVSLAITIVLYAGQRLLSFDETFDTMMDGFKSMLIPLGTVVASFMLKEVNDSLGLTLYVIDSVKPMMTPELLPMMVFLVMALIAFATGTFWGMLAVALPIVVPLAVAMDANIPLILGALMSAAAFGSHACFYGDSTVLSAQGSGCTAMQHALTQMPYALIAAAVSSVLFLVVA
ncbi:Na+/H+ antiporter NhaC family protein [Amphritea balenae]|uniref:Sodium:proton antiporter n=1 Tax=Amphritea balenae TaxID=452629 RepID=A0A3P1SY57_9GAMM|nr:Na+/H+ antiporter NhaC family protein [Amphritea balenae]RRD01486.1 sodium:proton antiporter [Amphritea balenae]GGK56672.1 sodium:proton antiporter [Amphritea balenae]